MKEHGKAGRRFEEKGTRPEKGREGQCDIFVCLFIRRSVLRLAH